MKTYSSGMYIRLAFAIAINVDPRLLIIDEILAVGDVTFQQRCLEKFVEFRNEGRTIVLVTHDLGAVKNMCDRAIWLTKGVVTGEGDPADLVETYTESMLGNRIAGSEAATRRGSGEIQVTRAELIVEDRSVKRFRTNDNVRIRMHYVATSRIERPVFGFAIATLGRLAVTSVCGRDWGVVPDWIEGEGYVDAIIEQISLVPGTYDLDVSITDYNRQHVYDLVNRIVRFDVMTGGVHEVGGVVTMRPQWVVQ